MTDFIGTRPAVTQYEATLLQSFRAEVAANTVRVAHLGGWDDRVVPTSLTDRIPRVDLEGYTVERGRGGFDAGVACAAGLIPATRQGLAATLHAAYTPAAIDQVRAEMGVMDPESDTTWWLAACSVCEEGTVDAAHFLAQLRRFSTLIKHPATRRNAARDQLADMMASFTVRDGVPYALRDGGMQGAYLAGHPLAVQYAADYDLWFIGTYRPTLGLERFEWAEPGDPKGDTAQQRSGRSGPVGGSLQFVKCRDEAELQAALAACKPIGA